MGCFTTSLESCLDVLYLRKNRSGYISPGACYFTHSTAPKVYPFYFSPQPGSNSHNRHSQARHVIGHSCGAGRHRRRCLQSEKTHSLAKEPAIISNDFPRTSRLTGALAREVELPPPPTGAPPEADAVVRVAEPPPAEAEADEGALTGLVVAADEAPEVEDGAAGGVVAARGPVDEAAADEAVGDVTAATGSTAGRASGTSGCFPDSGVVERPQARPKLPTLLP